MEAKQLRDALTRQQLEAQDNAAEREALAYKQGVRDGIREAQPIASFFIGAIVGVIVGLVIKWETIVAAFNV